MWMTLKGTLLSYRAYLSVPRDAGGSTPEPDRRRNPADASSTTDVCIEKRGKSCIIGRGSTRSRMLSAHHDQESDAEVQGCMRSTSCPKNTPLQEGGDRQWQRQQQLSDPSR